MAAYKWLWARLERLDRWWASRSGGGDKSSDDRAPSFFAVSSPPPPRAHVPKRVVLAGAPGSGKGSQGEKLARACGLVHVSCGALLRQAMAEDVPAGSPLGLAARAAVDSGKLVADALLVPAILERLSAEDCRARGWLLVGFPRTVSQARALSEAGLLPDCFLFLDTEDALLRARLLGRVVDPVTGKAYHLTHFPPPTTEIRTRCVRRADDVSESALRERLRVFRTETSAVMAFYKQGSVFVNGDRLRDDVVADLIAAVAAASPKHALAAASAAAAAAAAVTSGGTPSRRNLKGLLSTSFHRVSFDDGAGRGSPSSKPLSLTSLSALAPSLVGSTSPLSNGGLPRRDNSSTT
jgi:adenylate kinase